MTYGDWYELIAYFKSEDWTKKELACLAYVYKEEYEVSKQMGHATSGIKNLMKELFEQDSEEARAWFAQLSQEVNVPVDIMKS